MKMRILIQFIIAFLFSAARAQDPGADMFVHFSSFQQALPFAKSAIFIQEYKTGLRTLPPRLDTFANLEELHLTGNKLSSLSQSLCKLRNLRELSLGFNEITELPEEIGQLKNLEWLTIGNNRLKKLPESMKYLKKLRTLQMNDNQIEEWPEWLNSFENLDFLSVENNLFDAPDKVGKREWRFSDSIYSPGRNHLVYLAVSKWLEVDTSLHYTNYSHLYQIRVKNLRTGKTGILVRSNIGVGNLETLLFAFNNFSFSPDGRYLYFETPAWEKCEALHRVELATGKEKFVTDVLSYKVIRGGKWNGYFLTHKYVYDGEGTGSYCAVVNPNGKTALEIIEADFRNYDSSLKFMPQVWHQE